MGDAVFLLVQLVYERVQSKKSPQGYQGGYDLDRQIYSKVSIGQVFTRVIGDHHYGVKHPNDLPGAENTNQNPDSSQ